MTEENEYAPAWRPEPGQEIEGKVIQVDARESEYGVYPILTLEDEGGTQMAVHCIHSILRREIARRYEPTQIIGQPMKIRYVGKQQTQDGKRDFHNYKVFGGNRQSNYDWSQDLPEDGQLKPSTPSFESGPSVPVSGGAGSSAGATASSPIPEDWGTPLPASTEPSIQEKAAVAFDGEPPF